jgi:hypothetical protein
MEFFRVAMPSSAASFESILAAVEESPAGKSRARDLDGTHYRMQHVAQVRGGRFYEGEIMRVMTNEPINYGNLDGTVKSVPLDDNEGPCSETAFLYDSKTRSLCIQAGRHGVAASKLAKYCEVFGKVKEAIVASMIPQPELMRQLGQVRRATEFVVGFAGIENPAIVVGHGPRNRKAIELLHESKAPVFKVSITLGHGKRGRSLSVADVVASAKRLIGLGESDSSAPAVHSLEVVGKDDNDSPIHVHLLKSIMSAERNVKKGKDRRIAYNERRDAIRDAWQSKQPDIELLYPIVP